MARWKVPREGHRLVGRARERLLGSFEDTGAVPVHLPEPELRSVYRILNFALRAGGLMLKSGAGTLEVESTILALTEACGLRRCEVDVTFTSMTASYIREDDVEPVTTLHVIRHRTVDYRTLAGIHAMRRDLTRGRITPEEAFARLDALVAAPPRRRAAVLLSWSGMAAAFTVLLGGGPLAAAVAFVSTMAVTLANRRLARSGLPDFFLAALGAAVATAFAMALVALHAPARTSVVVAGGIMVLVPGFALVASVQDALTGFPISGSARGLEVLFIAAGIISGIAAVLYASVPLGLSTRLSVVALTTSLVRVPVQVVAAGVAAMLYGAATSVPRRSLVGAGAVGAVGWAVFLLLREGNVSFIVSTGIAATSVGVLGNVLAGRRGTHPFLYVVPGVMPLVPGLTMYQGMLELFAGSTSSAATLLRALAMGLAIAAGVTLGNMAVRPLRRPAGNVSR